MLLTRSLYPFRSWRSAMSEMDRLRQEMGRVMGSVSGDFEPPQAAGVLPLINVSEDSDKFVVTAELPGVASEDINVSVVGKSLSLQGERKPAKAEAGVRFHRKERPITAFNRVIGLPSEVQADKVEAKNVNGVLHITLPKAEAAKPRQITVQAL
ncbi:MAG: Hsp20/alpha crystallin family protein [Desulfarculaceae bacterium]